MQTADPKNAFNMNLELNFDGNVKEENLRSSVNVLISKDLKIVAGWTKRVIDLADQQMFADKIQVSEMNRKIEENTEAMKKSKSEQNRSIERMETDKVELEKLNKELELLKDNSCKEIQRIELETLSEGKMNLEQDIKTLKRQVNKRAKQREKTQKQCEELSKEAVQVVLETIQAISNDRKRKREQLLEMKHLLLDRREQIHCYDVKEPTEILPSIKKH